MTSTVEDGASESRELPDGHVGQSGGEPTEGGNFSVKKYTPRSYDKLVTVDPQIIIDRVAQGDLLREIAKDYGCAFQTVSEFIKRNVDPKVWASVREHSVAARLEKSTEQIETAPDQLELARARESARLWMWRAERELPHLYGIQKQQLNISGNQVRVEIVDFAQQSAAALPDNTYSAEDTDSK